MKRRLKEKLKKKNDDNEVKAMFGSKSVLS